MYVYNVRSVSAWRRGGGAAGGAAPAPPCTSRLYTTHEITVLDDLTNNLTITFELGLE